MPKKIPIQLSIYMAMDQYLIYTIFRFLDEYPFVYQLFWSPVVQGFDPSLYRFF